MTSSPRKYKLLSSQYRTRRRVEMKGCGNLLLSVLALLTPLVVQSDRACTLEVPVGVVTSNAILISGLTADSFVASTSKTSIRVREAVYDSSARRIVFAIDDRSRLNWPARATASRA